MAPVEVDGTPREWELARAAYRAEMLLNRALIAMDEMLPHATDPQHVVDLITLEDILTGRSKAMAEIRHGTPVIVTDADGIEHAAVALSATEVKGHSFPIIWVMVVGHLDSRIPWPVESVRPADQAERAS